MDYEYRECAKRVLNMKFRDLESMAQCLVNQTGAGDLDAWKVAHMILNWADSVREEEIYDLAQYK